MDGAGHAGAIISSLASLPDFLRRPILERRMGEFFALGPGERDEMVAGALDAGPGLPFPVFERLLVTWFGALAAMPEDRREAVVSAYVSHACASPHRLARLNLDGVLGAFLSLGEAERGAIAATAGRVAAGLDPESRRRLLLVIPSGARVLLGL